MTVYKHIFRHVFLIALLCVPFAVFSQSIANAQAQQNEIPVSDLGIREQGQVYPLKLTAVNVDCDAPQDFEFEIDNTPWLTTPGNPVAYGLGPGQRRSLPAQLDFTYTPPGIYYGHVTSRCTSCGWFIFASCFENGQDVVLKVTVADPADPQNGANLLQTPNPYAGVNSYVPSTIALFPQIRTSDESLLTAEERNRLFVARSRVKAAQRRGEKARDDVRAARLKKNDCERELARLKAAMEAAKRAAATADQDAANAQGAANAAAKALADFEKDRVAAALTVKLALEGARGQTTYLVDVINSDGGDSPRAQRARQFLKDADEAQRVANAAKANAASAHANASAATARYNAKARECQGLGAAKSAAEKKLVDAENAAKHAVGIANYEETEAKKKADKARKEAIAQGVRDLKKELKKKKEYCKRQREDMAAEIAKLKRAMDVGQKLKIFEDDGGKRANTMKEVNDKIWDAAADEAKNKMDPFQADLSSAEGIYNSALSAMGLATDAIGSAIGAGGAPSVGQDQMLGGLKALAMAVQGQVAAIRNPNTLAAMRNESADLRRSKESFQAQKMKDMGIGKNAAERAEIQKTINEIYRNPDLISKLILRSGKQAARCARELKKLEAKLAAAKSAK